MVACGNAGNPNHRDHRLASNHCKRVILNKFVVSCGCVQTVDKYNALV